MGLSAILGFVALAGAVLLMAGIALAVSNSTQRRPMRGGILMAAIGGAVAVVFYVFSSGLVELGPTQVAVVFQRFAANSESRGLREEPLGPGVHIVVPILNEVYVYSTEARSFTMSKDAASGRGAVQARTRDGQQVSIDVSVLYEVDPARVNKLHLSWQNRFEDSFVLATVRSAVRDSVASYSVNDLYGGSVSVTGTEAVLSKLPQLQKELFDMLTKSFESNGLRLRELLLREISFSEEFIRAVEAKQVAQQQAEQAEQEKRRRIITAEGEADAKVTEAKGEATANEARAQGEANAIKLRAAAEAEALRLINEQLSKNPILLQWRYIEQLAPNIRMILVPSNSPFLFNSSDLLSGTDSSTGTTTVPKVTVTPTPSK